MVRDIVENIDFFMDFSDVKHGIVELIEDSNGGFRPAKYISNGNYEDVNFFTMESKSYWRVNGEVKNRVLENRNACDFLYQRVYPMKYIFVTLKECDIEDDIFNLIVSKTEENRVEIRKSLGFRNLIFDVKGYSFDRKKVSGQEYKGLLDYKTKYTVISVDIDIVIDYKSKCLKDLCYDI